MVYKLIFNIYDNLLKIFIYYLVILLIKIFQNKYRPYLNFLLYQFNKKVSFKAQLENYYQIQNHNLLTPL